jgi:hypothetical protein
MTSDLFLTREDLLLPRVTVKYGRYRRFYGRGFATEVHLEVPDPPVGKAARRPLGLTSSSGSAVGAASAKKGRLVAGECPPLNQGVVPSGEHGSNVVPARRSCNSRKRDRLLTEWRGTLRPTPSRARRPVAAEWARLATETTPARVQPTTRTGSITFPGRSISVRAPSRIHLCGHLSGTPSTPPE